jgi:hypothetical protein
LISFFLVGRADWHLNRNQLNQLPDGNLTHLKGNEYLDDSGLSWELQPAIKNKFHQPGYEIPKPERPYPNVKGDISYDPKNANLKFLSKLENGGSYEAILQPDGTYLTTGKKQGTYNYGHPDGFLGTFKHVLFDVIPHFSSAKYKP